MSQKIKKLKIGALPILHTIAERMELKEILYDFIPVHGNEKIPAVESLLLFIYNIVLGRNPLYNLEDWTESIDFRCMNLEDFSKDKFNDDRFGRALDKLYDADRATLMTRIVTTIFKKFNIDASQIHNDSTSVKAFGKIKGKTKSGLKLMNGNSKDHRPDLKQLVYNLSITADGAVPVHYHCYPGNYTDDKIHIEVWDNLTHILNNCEFLYVADSKLCTDNQLMHITQKHGRAITIIPQTWSETSEFRDALRLSNKSKKEISRKKIGGRSDKIDYFSVFNGTYLTKKRKFRIHWIHSSEKKKRDKLSREKRLENAEYELTDLNAKLNLRKLKEKKAIENAVKDILKSNGIEGFLDTRVGTVIYSERRQIGKGRPGPDTKFKKIETEEYTLNWNRNREALKIEKRIDGIFPLLCTDEKLSSKEVLEAYKYQPRIEKRFCQFKNIHNAAPLLFKSIERVESCMFAFFISLIIQALIEREIRTKMKKRKIRAVEVYPEDRDATHPTTTKVLGIFQDVCSYKITHPDSNAGEYRDELTELQILILDLLNMSENTYWKDIF